MPAKVESEPGGIGIDLLVRGETGHGFQGYRIQRRQSFEQCRNNKDVFGQKGMCRIE